MHVWLLLSQNKKCIKISLSLNVEGSVEQNHNILCVYGLSKGCNSGMTKYINSVFSGNNKGDDQLTKKAIFAYYYYYKYYCFYCYHKYYYYYYFYHYNYYFCTEKNSMFSLL